jgi:hypothetical protein
MTDENLEEREQIQEGTGKNSNARDPKAKREFNSLWDISKYLLSVSASLVVDQIKSRRREKKLSRLFAKWEKDGAAEEIRNVKASNPDDENK